MKALIINILNLFRFVNDVFPTAFCVFSWSLLFLVYFKPDLNELLSNSFLITYLGVIIGFGLTIFAFIIAMTEKIAEKLNKSTKISRIEKKKKAIKIVKIKSEMEDDIRFCFICLIISIFLTIWNKIDLPFISIEQYKNFLTKNILLDSLKLTILSLSILAIYDMMSTSFKLSSLTTEIK